MGKPVVELAFYKNLGIGEQADIPGNSLYKVYRTEKGQLRIVSQSQLDRWLALNDSYGPTSDYRKGFTSAKQDKKREPKSQLRRVLPEQLDRWLSQNSSAKQNKQREPKEQTMSRYARNNPPSVFSPLADLVREFGTMPPDSSDLSVEPYAMDSNPDDLGYRGPYDRFDGAYGARAMTFVNRRNPAALNNEGYGFKNYGTNIPDGKQWGGPDGAFAAIASLAHATRRAANCDLKQAFAAARRQLGVAPKPGAPTVAVPAVVQAAAAEAHEEMQQGKTPERGRKINKLTDKNPRYNAFRKADVSGQEQRNAIIGVAVALRNENPLMSTKDLLDRVVNKFAVQGEDITELLFDGETPKQYVAKFNAGKGAPKGKRGMSNLQVAAQQILTEEGCNLGAAWDLAAGKGDGRAGVAALRGRLGKRGLTPEDYAAKAKTLIAGRKAKQDKESMALLNPAYVGMTGEELQHRFDMDADPAAEAELGRRLAKAAAKSAKNNPRAEFDVYPRYPGYKF